MISAIPLRCPNCDARQAVEVDECGAELELWPCQGSDTCTAQVCRNCRVQCYSCGLYACEEHVAVVDGEQWCAGCELAAVAAPDEVFA